MIEFLCPNCEGRGCAACLGDAVAADSGRPHTREERLAIEAQMPSTVRHKHGAYAGLFCPQCV